MNHPHNPSAPVILTIAGFDPSGGAGIAADLKTFGAHGCYGVAAITALTIQNTQEVSATQAVDGSMLSRSVKALLSDGQVRAIKIGMLGSPANAAVVRDVLESHPALPGVLDPVLRSGKGVELSDAQTFAFLRDHLLSAAAVVTPNLDEAAALTGLPVENVDQMKTAARRLVEMGARAVVVTGGHLDKATDVFLDGTRLEIFAHEKIRPDNTHGTGCTFSSAIAANLARGRPVQEAVILAKAYVTESIRKAYATGPGRLPLNHLYRIQETPRLDDRAPALA